MLNDAPENSTVFRTAFVPAVNPLAVIVSGIASAVVSVEPKSAMDPAPEPPVASGT